jgi:uncharacterized protein with GYD domain
VRTSRSPSCYLPRADGGLGDTMPHYVSLVNWTDQGIRAVKDSPKRSEAFRKGVEAAGGKVVAMLYTMGKYDLVGITELPSDEVANELALRLGMLGNVRSVTLKGWTESEMAKLIQKL